MSDGPAPTHGLTFLAGGGEMGALLRAHDWSASSLGPPETWPERLKAAVELMLASPQPVYVAWGPELASLYNNDYAPILGDKHPDAVGKPYAELFAEIWDEFRPVVEATLAGERQLFVDRPVALVGRADRSMSWFTFSWTPLRDESGMVAGIYCTAFETTEKVLAAEALRAANEAMLREKDGRFRTLFTAMDQGCLLADVIFDAKGEAVDIEYVEANPAAVRLVGVDLTGRRLSEVADYEPYWYEIWGRVARTGVPERLERYAGPEGRWYDFYIHKPEPENAESRRVAILFRDVTSRKQAEAAQAESEARLRFLDRLGAATQALTDATEIMRVSVRLLGEHLGADVCAYADMEPDEDGFTIRGDWTTPGSSSIVGAYSLAAFGEEAVRELRAGRPLVTRDTLAELGPEQASLFLQLGLKATVCMPLVKEGRLTALMAVHSASPRNWTTGEIALVSETTERSWAHIERTRSEAALRVSEERYRTLFEAIDAGFCIIEMIHDAEDRPVDYLFLEANPAFERQAGFGFATGRRMRELVPDHEQHWFDIYDRVAKTGEPIQVEQGSAALGRWWSLHALRVGDPAQPRVAVLFNDISDRRRAEVALHELNETLEARVAERTAERDRIWNNSRDLLLVCDTAGVLHAVNPAWTTLLGWRSDELVGRNVVDMVLPDDAGATSGALEEAAAEGNLTSFENRYGHKDGSVRWISWRTMTEGDLIYCIGRDVTAEKERQAELEAAQEALRQAQKMEAVGQLTGGLAHDFNNLLAGVSGSLELMGTRIAQGRIAEVERYLVAAQGAAKRAAALTHRLLAFSRRQTLDPKPTSVNALVSGMEELIRRTVGPQVALECVTGAGVWSVLVDPNQLENALLNLCLNARDAMPDGGKLVIETANRWLDERAARERDLPPGQYVSLCVSDNGVGMTPEEATKAFDPFFTTKPIGLGTGLGLSMVYGFARQSGGQARIYSEIGRGAMVCLYLPRHLDEAEGTESPPEGAGAAPGGTGETVLVIDDEPLVRMLVVDVLEELGYGVIEADDGPAGLRVLQGGVRVDLLITDVGLPGGMNGRQVADAARALRPGLKVMFITGYAENAVLNHGHLDHGMSVVTKPFGVEELGRRIKAVLSGG